MGVYPKFSLLTAIASTVVSMYFIGCGSSHAVTTQCYSIEQFKRFSPTTVQFYVMQVKDGEKDRLDLFIQMPYANLTFERNGSMFNGRYAAVMNIKNGLQEIIHSNETERNVVAENYDETISQRSDRFVRSFTINPGEYLLEVVVTDLLSKNTSLQRRLLTMNRRDSLAVSASSPLFLDTIMVNNGVYSIHPIFPNDISQVDHSFGVFQELYGVSMSDTFLVSTSYRTSTPHYNCNEIGQGFTFIPYRISSTPCSDKIDTVSFQMDSVIVSSRSGTLQLFQSYPLPAPGFTIITRRISQLNGGIDIFRSTERVFLRESQFRDQVTPVEMAAVMRYVERNNELDTLVCSNQDSLKAHIAGFWKNHGGELRRREFEKRIMEANKLFTSCNTGSLTPMGIVFVICGTPDYIDCRTPLTENWYYNIGEKVISIQFRAVRSDHPEYYELVPYSVNESFWQYQVEKWRRK